VIGGKEVTSFGFGDDCEGGQECRRGPPCVVGERYEMVSGRSVYKEESRTSWD
jgi:hypothetical protein